MARPSKPRNRHPGGVIDTLPSGSLRVRVDGGIDPVTKRRHRPTVVIPAGPDAEKQAKAALVRLINEVNERRQPKTNATVNQLLDRYLDQLQIGRKTKNRYRGLTDLHLRPLIGTEKAGRVDGEIIDSLYAELRRCRIHCKSTKGLIDHRTPRSHECDQRCVPHTCRPLAENTIRQIHYILSGAYKKAVRWTWVSVSPIDAADAPAPSRANPQPPSPEEAAAIVNRAWRNDADWGTQVWLTMVTGSRRGETCAIRWRHLDLDNRVLHMQKAIAQDGRDIWETDTKTHQDRRIVLDEETVGLMIEHRQRCLDRAQALGIELSDDAFVFSPEPDGSVPIRPDTVTQRYRRLVQRLDIDTHLHALRHYSATELIAAGVDIRTVAGRLGHGGGGTTTLRVYAAWLSEADQRAADTLSGRMPDRPVALDPAQRALVSPEAVFEQVAWKVRQQVLDGALSDGGPAPSLKEIVAEHGVSMGTAHRATELLRAWGVVTAAEGRGRGQRGTIVRPTEEPPPPPSPPAAPNHGDTAPGEPTALELRVLCLGETVRTVTAEADPNDLGQLGQLLKAAARRHGGPDAPVADYEMEVRRAGDDHLITTFVAI